MKRTLVLFCLAFVVPALAHADPALVGTWEATVERSRSFDTFLVTFSENGRCIVRVADDASMQETTGNWSYDGSLLRLDAAFRNPAISRVRNIRWSSVLNLAADGTSFSILGITESGGRQTRITFFRQDGEPERAADIMDERAVPLIFASFSRGIPAGSRIAVIGIEAPSGNEALFYANELTRHFVNAGQVVLERRQIDAVFKENDIQLSGLVDDDAIVSVGRFMGATVVITGSIDTAGRQKRLTVKAIDVLTSRILAIESANLRD